MRQTEPMTHPGLHENGLTKILADVVEEVRLSIDKDINGADLLHSLLSAPWLNSLLRVYECLLEYTGTSPTPCLLYASALSQEIMGNMRSLAAPSPEAQELYMLLRAPHFQALLSAHDSVAQKDYSPVLPPLPDDLPEDEEAMRIVCLVKNKQPLATGGLTASSGVLHTPPIVRPLSTKRTLCLCDSQLSGGGLNQSVPAVCSLVPVENGMNENHCLKWTCTQTTSSTSAHSPQSSCMGFSSRVSSQPHTAPASPLLRTHRSFQSPCSHFHTLEHTKQHSLDEFKSTMNSMASSLEHSSRGVSHLRCRMVAATKRMTDSVEENTQALSLLVEVVDKLQGLIIASKSPNLSCVSRAPDVPELPTALKTHGVLSRPANVAEAPSISCKGATIKKDEKTGDIFIARVIHGGLADRSGLLYAGDRLVEVNGEPVEGLEPAQVIQILVHSQGTILFKLIPNSPQPANNQATLYVRAMVDYNPLLDPSIPCPDAGMAFSRGDLLEIVDQKDIQWWQARLLPNATACAGLVPSTSHFRSKKREFWWSQSYQAHTCIRPSGFRHSLRLWRRKALNKRRQSCHSCGPNSCHSASASPYEEVLNYQRNVSEPPRLVVLMGPPGVGVNELRRRLIKINPSAFQGPIPYTTRPPRSGEVNGREYHFTTKELFEYLMVNHKFIEYGEHKSHLYGTCYDSIKDVLDSGKTCVIDIEPHCIHAVRTKKLKPYIIFVKPPSLERMKLTRRDPKFIASSCFKRAFRDEDFEEVAEAGRMMEAQYSQFFDCVIVNDRLQDACMDLFAAIQHAQEQPQWIPANWISLDES
ncbi:hypothetical protein NFI96_018474 [Prochilodus magdalenae]|nr:hypothetical protein NFI96_018474 [Prochilodus magdalenae]